MKQDSKTFQINFPRRDLSKIEGQDLVLRSCDIVGVAGLRAAQVRDLALKNRLSLLNYVNFFSNQVLDIYQVELAKTLVWLGPTETRVATLDFDQEQRDLFLLLFPKTKELLGDLASKHRDLYLKQMPVDSWLLQDHWRYFAGFLRQQLPDQKKIIQICHWEAVWAWLEVQAIPEHSFESDFLRVTSSLQTVNLEQEAAECLGLKPGLFAVWFDEENQKIQKYHLNPLMAHYLDLMQEDRKYRDSQLVEMASLQTGSKLNVSREDWENAFLCLTIRGIIKGDSIKIKE